MNPYTRLYPFFATQGGGTSIVQKKIFYPEKLHNGGWADSTNFYHMYSGDEGQTWHLRARQAWDDADRLAANRSAEAA